jgi:uncharacterized protein (TIGR00369 family)
MLTREEHWRRLERLYLGAPTNEYYRPAIHIGEGVAEIRIDIRREFHHAANAVHGSVYFKMLDDAGFFAANSVVEDVLVLTSDFSLHLFRPVSVGTLTAKGKLVNAAKRMFVADAELFDSKGQLIAHGVGSYVRSRIDLPPGERSS